MNGKITMSRRGRTGRTSGIFAGSSSLSLRSSSVIGVLASAASSSSASRRATRRVGDNGKPPLGKRSLASFFFPGDGDDRFAAPPVLQARKGDRQYPGREVGGGLGDIHGRVEEDRAAEAAVGPLHAQEAGHAGGAGLAPLPAHHELSIAARDAQRLGA